jgi:transcriptional accessory protein Tex/SPT6
MDFVETIKRIDRELYDSSDKTALPKLARALERSKGMAGLLKNGDAILKAFPISNILRLANAFREFESWKTAFRETKKILITSKLNLPDESLKQTVFPHELSALVRTARMCPRAGYSDISSWTEAVNAHLDLWNACLNIAMSKGTVSIKMANPEHEEAADFENFICTAKPVSEIKNFIWLGAKRGQQAKILEIKTNIPEADIVEQTKLYMPKLGLAARSRNIEHVIEELIGNNLKSVLLSLIDKRAQAEAIQTAQNAYDGLLTTEPLKTDLILAIAVCNKKEPPGFAVLDGKGKIINSDQLSHQWMTTINKLIEEYSLNKVVIPVTAPDSDTLRKLSNFLTKIDNIDVINILNSAIKEPAEKLQVKISLPPAVSKAVILARRALFPFEEWGSIDPVAISLGEYSSDLNPEILKAALLDAKMLAIYKLRFKNNSGNLLQSRGLKKRKRLNPMIKTIRDLRPGMMLDGIITNLTRFGAFVNIGLSTEAMIHVSQLSVEFVDEPSQVVRVGQSVVARVLDVVPEKSRIALTLKPASEEGTRPNRTNFGALAKANSNANALFDSSKLDKNKPKPANYRQHPAEKIAAGSSNDAPKSRNEALADLDALFKK